MIDDGLCGNNNNSSPPILAPLNGAGPTWVGEKRPEHLGQVSDLPHRAQTILDSVSNTMIILPRSIGTMTATEPKL